MWIHGGHHYYTRPTTTTRDVIGADIIIKLIIGLRYRMYPLW